jgi:hypothetical protein
MFVKTQLKSLNPVYDYWAQLELVGDPSGRLFAIHTYSLYQQKLWPCVGGIFEPCIKFNTARGNIGLFETMRKDLDERDSTTKVFLESLLREIHMYKDFTKDKL